MSQKVYRVEHKSVIFTSMYSIQKGNFSIFGLESLYQWYILLKLHKASRGNSLTEENKTLTATTCTSEDLKDETETGKNPQWTYTGMRRQAGKNSWEVENQRVPRIRC